MIESDVDDTERAVGVVVMLFGREAPLNEYMLNKAIKYLQRGESIATQQSRKQDIDIVRDINYIATSVQSQYHLNIRDTDIHFWHFVDLIEGLKGTLINDIRDIRDYDISEVKDVKQRRAIIEMKNHYSLGGKMSKPMTIAELYEDVERRKRDG